MLAASNHARALFLSTPTSRVLFAVVSRAKIYNKQRRNEKIQMKKTCVVVAPCPGLHGQLPGFARRAPILSVKFSPAVSHSSCSIFLCQRLACACCMCEEALSLWSVL